MTATNQEARALALDLARKHFDGIPVWPSGDREADAPYWQAIKKVRKGLYAAGYNPHLVHNAAVRGLGTLRKERALQEAPAP